MHDIAFAVGVLTLLGRRISPALRVLLFALAVIDDIGSIIVIALFYSSEIAFAGLGLCGLGLAGVLAMRAAGARAPLLYVAPGAVVWSGLLIAGIHPTVAGVALGLLTPVRTWFGPAGFAAATKPHLEALPEHDRATLLARLDQINAARREAVSPAERLIHALHPWVAFGVMPIFALANAGVVVQGARLAGDSLWLFVGIVAGLAAGKPLGIAAATLGATRARIATRSAEITRRGLIQVGLVGGIGFTMALFIAQLAFPTGVDLDTAKLAILVGSGAATATALGFGLTRKRTGTPIDR